MLEVRPRAQHPVQVDRAQAAAVLKQAVRRLPEAPAAREAVGVRRAQREQQGLQERVAAQALRATLRAAARPGPAAPVAVR